MSCCGNEFPCKIIKTFGKRYLCSYAVSELDFEDYIQHISDLDYSSQELHCQTLLDFTVENPDLKKFPVNPLYSRAFLKRLLLEVEKIGLDYSPLYFLYTDFLNKEPSSDVYYRHFKVGNKTIVIEENSSIISQGTTGLSTWQGGKALAEWCLREGGDELLERDVLELGCGLGLTGLTICSSDSCHPKSYCFTDSHPSVLAAVSRNCALNSDNLITQKVDVLPLDWQEVENFDSPFAPNIILAADVVFDPRDFDYLCKTLHYFLKRKESTAIIACTIRHSDTFNKFLDCLGKYNLVIIKESIIEPKIFLFPTNPEVKILCLKSGQ